jgi:AraC-like DNA-binding protein
MYPLQNDSYKRLIRARAFIDECYDLPLDLEQIAGQASFSRYHFLRLFRSTFDQTPGSLAGAAYVCRFQLAARVTLEDCALVYHTILPTTDANATHAVVYCHP